MTATFKFDNFQQMWTHFYLVFYGVPAPKLGGTFHHCLAEVEVKVPKIDSLGRRTRYTTTENRQCGSRFRAEKTYRRHYRRVHRRT